MWIKRGRVIFQNYSRNQKRVGLAVILLIIAMLAFSGYFLFFYAKQCENAGCFVDALTHCERASWIREDIRSTWLYTIKGNAEGEACKVEVQLLKIKEGTIDKEELQGEKMTCIILKNEIKLPEKDLAQCTGLLKEKLQEIIIKKIHDYLLKNTAEVEGELGEFEEI